MVNMLRPLGRPFASEKMTKKDAGAKAAAIAFVEARRNRKPLDAYPGEKPASLAEAYRIQDIAIDRWGDAPVGWKVGRINGADAQALGVDRLAGPIFPEFMWTTETAPAALGVFSGGFAAVEGEIVAIIGETPPADKTDWTADEALAIIGGLYAGVEIASSPYARINEDGPLVTISDFGNNFGLIIGDEIPDWRSLRLNEWQCQTHINDKLVGENAPSSIPGGPIESLRFLLANTAERGIPLTKGMAVCTGAVTGVHEIRIGQRARIAFAGVSPIEFTVTDAIETIDARGE